MHVGEYITERLRELAELRERHDRYLRCFEEALPTESAWTADVELPAGLDLADAELTVRRRVDTLAGSSLDEYCDASIASALHKALQHVSGNRNRDLAAHTFGEPKRRRDHPREAFGLLVLIRFADTLRDRGAVPCQNGDPRDARPPEASIRRVDDQAMNAARSP